jgi:hypothetical protein
MGVVAATMAEDTNISKNLRLTHAPRVKKIPLGVCVSWVIDTGA